MRQNGIMRPPSDVSVIQQFVYRWISWEKRSGQTNGTPSVHQTPLRHTPLHPYSRTLGFLCSCVCDAIHIQMFTGIYSHIEDIYRLGTTVLCEATPPSTKLVRPLWRYSQRAAQTPCASKRRKPYMWEDLVPYSSTLSSSFPIFP